MPGKPSVISQDIFPVKVQGHFIITVILLLHSLLEGSQASLAKTYILQKAYSRIKSYLKCVKKQEWLRIEENPIKYYRLSLISEKTCTCKSSTLGAADTHK